MSKLIHLPLECILRHKVTTRLGLDSGIRTCKHGRFVAGHQLCPDPMKFPDNCPLEEGIPKKSIHWP